MDKIKSLTGMLDLYDDGDNSLLPAKLFYLEEKIKHIFKSLQYNQQFKRFFQGLADTLNHLLKV